MTIPTALRRLPALALGVALVGPLALAQLTPALLGEVKTTAVIELDDRTVMAVDPSGTYFFTTWEDYFASRFFAVNGKRCDANGFGEIYAASTIDCSSVLTNPKPE